MTGGRPSTAAERLAHFATNLTPSSVPDEVLQKVSLHLLDTIGCGLAAVGTGAAPFAKALGANAAPGNASALSVPSRIAPTTAALVNGISCHTLDFDDTHPKAMSHVSAVVVPAALAAAQDRGASGLDLAMAALVGNEVTTRIGREAGDAFHVRGFHPTAICGVFGATAAVARLTSLSAETTAHAFGLAGSMASGLLAYLSDGSETKSVHPGWMAHASLTAVELAGCGATGPAAVLEGRHGIYAAFIDRHDVAGDDLTADLGERWETLDIAVKPYPACHFVHAPLDALIALNEQHHFEPDAVERITVLTPQAGADLISEPVKRKRRPTTAYESKFSAPYALAAWLHAGAVDVTSFAEPLLSDPAVLALAEKVDHEVHRYSSYPGSLPGGVRVRLRSGEEFEHHVPHERGGRLNPMTSEEVREKFRRNARTALPERALTELETAVMRVAEQPDLSALEVLAEAAPR